MEKAQIHRSCFKTQFPLRTAAISSRCVVGTKFVLDVALATPAAILNLRLARENFARSRDESSFETASSKIFTVILLLLVMCSGVFGRARRRPDSRRRSAPEPQMRFGQLETNNVYTGINNSRIDGLVMQALRRQGIQPANLCSDEVFIRRVYLDVNGSLPEPRDVESFLENRSPHKRATLINRLLKREEFADYWALKWCDLLRVKAEFPINL